MMSEYENAFVFSCEGCGLTAEFARGGPGSFLSCVDEIKHRGWRIERTRDGDYRHRCGGCRKSGADILNQTFRRVK
jgi:hypothetical protein